MRPLAVILFSCSSGAEDKASGVPLDTGATDSSDSDADTDTDADADSDSDSDTDTGVLSSETGDTALLSSCGDPDLGIQSFVVPSAGETWEATYHTDLCVDSSGVSGWYSVSYTTLGGDLICHAGWEVLSSSSAWPPGGSPNLDAWTLVFSGQIGIVGNCLPMLGYLGAYQDMDVSLSPFNSILWTKPSVSYSWSEWGPGSYDSTHSISVVDLGYGLWSVELDDYGYQGVVP